VVATGTLKEADADKMVEEISKIGIPSAIASDVKPAPSFVLKASARFNVRTFTPERSMLEREKNELAPSMKNLHERDALSAAIKCYRMYANRLRQIEAMNTKLDRDLLKHLVIQGYPLHSAIAMLEPRQEKQDQNPPRPKSGPATGGSEKLLYLTMENVNLKTALDAEIKKNEALEQEIKKIKMQHYAERGKDSEVRRLRAQVKKMGWIIAKLKRKLG